MIKTACDLFAVAITLDIFVIRRDMESVTIMRFDKLLEFFEEEIREGGVFEVKKWATWSEESGFT